MIISGALRTTPTVVLGTIFGPSLFDLCSGVVPDEIGRRYWATGQWRGSNTDHSDILEKFEALGDDDHIITRYDFSMKFRATIKDKEV